MKRWLAVTVTGAVLALGAPAGAQQELTPDQDAFWEREEIAINARCLAWVRGQGEPRFEAYKDTDRHRFLGTERGRFLFKKCLTELSRARVDELVRQHLQPTGQSR